MSGLRSPVVTRITRTRWSRSSLALGLVAFAAVGSCLAGPETGAESGPSASVDASVLEYHKRASRDGHYVEPAFTRAAAATMQRDPSFQSAPLSGPIFAQPLYWAGTNPGDADLLFVATEHNDVFAVDASSGQVVWRRSLGPPVPRKHLPCGFIDPLGVTGTPIIDPASRTLFVAAMTTPDRGTSIQHIVTALSIDDGAMRAGWPVDVSAVQWGSAAFDAAAQGQRGGLALLGGTLYVPYSGHFGDCGEYRGWVVGIPLADPTAVQTWATHTRGGGVWAPSGISSDGAALYVGTGNTFPHAPSAALRVKSWLGGQAIIRLHPGPVFSQRPADFFTPNFRLLDVLDLDLGGTGPMLLEVPGATPSQLILALGKDGHAYLIDRADMGGTEPPLDRRFVSRTAIINGATTYRTPSGTYVAFKGVGISCSIQANLTAVRITATAPPRNDFAWCAAQRGVGSPITTTTDGTAESIVWSVGAEGDGRLHGFDGETGHVVFDGRGADDVMRLVQRYQTPIVAKGRIFVAGFDRLYAFKTK